MLLYFITKYVKSCLSIGNHDMSKLNKLFLQICFDPVSNLYDKF